MIVLALMRMTLRTQGRAMLVTGVLSLLPFFSWTASAVAAAALMRYGLAASGVQLVLILGALVHYWVWGELTMLILIPGIWLAAATTRMLGMSMAMLTLPIYALALLWYLDIYLPPLMQDELYQYFLQLQERTEADLSALLGIPLNEGLEAFSRAITFMLAFGMTLMVLAFWLVGRYLQVDSEKPFSFAAEWKLLRLPISGVVVLLVLLALGRQLGYGWPLLVQYVGLPLLLTGLGLLHWLGNRWSWGKLVFGVYPLVLFLPLVYWMVVALGLTDSWGKWRERLLDDSAT